MPPAWNPVLNDLILLLAGLYTDLGKTRLAVRRAGLDPNEIDLAGVPKVVWERIIEEANKRGAVPALLRVAKEDFPSVDFQGWKKKIATVCPAEVEWPGDLGAVETPVGLNHLPIDERSPPVFGVAIDVSGSMQSAMRPFSDDKKSRLEGVVEALRTLASHYHAQAESPEVTRVLGLGKLFAYGFGFSDRAAKYGQLATLFQRIDPRVPPIPARIFTDTVRDLLDLKQARFLRPDLAWPASQWRRTLPALPQQEQV